MQVTCYYAAICADGANSYLTDSGNLTAITEYRFNNDATVRTAKTTKVTF